MHGREHRLPRLLVEERELDERPGKPGRFPDPFPIEDDGGWTIGQPSSSIRGHSQR